MKDDEKLLFTIIGVWLGQVLVPLPWSNMNLRIKKKN
jgi:hypothetical protein